MDSVSVSEHLCYVRCAYCNTILAVGVPRSRLTETITVKCGHCNNLSLLNPNRSSNHFANSNNYTNNIIINNNNIQTQCSDQLGLVQDPNSETRKGQNSSSSSSTSNDQNDSNASYVVRPPEKKHRQPSAYNHFMKEEIQRIKAVYPKVPHREAFSMAAKNWAKCEPRPNTLAYDSSNGSVVKQTSVQHGNGGDIFPAEEGSFNLFREMNHKETFKNN